MAMKLKLLIKWRKFTARIAKLGFAMIRLSARSPLIVFANLARGFQESLSGSFSKDYKRNDVIDLAQTCSLSG